MKDKYRFSPEKLTLGLLGMIYLGIYLRRMMSPYPSRYRRNVQKNMKYVAETVASGGNPYTPPYPEYYSTAGGNLHGVVGAPFKLIFEFPQSSRLGVVIMGLISLVVFYFILKEIGIRRRVSLLSVSFLLLYPQYILFFSQGNPSAADIFFGVISVYTYLRWHTVQSKKWLYLSSVSAGLATFSHFYAGVITIGIILHYIIVRSDDKRRVVNILAVYIAGMLPALGLLAAYKLLFATQDPNSHYFDRLIINSFHNVYYTAEAFDSDFPVYSLDFLNALLEQHGDRSPIFGYWWVTTITSLVLGSWLYLSDSHRESWTLISSWIVAGLLIIVIIPGGAIYHDYYTWWLLMGVVAGLSLSLEAALSAIESASDVRRTSFAVVTIVSLLAIVIQSLISPHSVIVV